MKTFLYLILAVIPLLSACESVVDTRATKGDNQQQALPNWKTEIDKAMALQQNAWNRGQLKEYMAPYLQSDSLMFVGRRGLNYGWETTLNNYQKSYPNREAMGTLQFTNKEYKLLGSKNALVIGQWHLYRISDTLQGYYSLNWQLVDGHWKIIADHSS
jgi:hypothetical protein